MPLALTACGFTPAFGTKGPAQVLVGTVHAADPVDKNGFDFVQRIEERFGRPSQDLYDLTYVITTTIVGVGITLDGAITRYNLTGALDWTLTRRADKLRMTGGHIDQFTSYSATGSSVAGLTAETDAALRLMRLLADEVVLRVTAASASFPP
jgi:LPS-assembly lipoprotein